MGMAIAGIGASSIEQFLRFMRLNAARHIPARGGVAKQFGLPCGRYCYNFIESRVTKIAIYFAVFISLRR
jgi:hypothetical protein